MIRSKNSFSSLIAKYGSMQITVTCKDILTLTDSFATLLNHYSPSSRRKAIAKQQNIIEAIKLHNSINYAIVNYISAYVDLIFFTIFRDSTDFSHDDFGMTVQFYL